MCMCVCEVGRLREVFIRHCRLLHKHGRTRCACSGIPQLPPCRTQPPLRGSVLCVRLFNVDMRIGNFFLKKKKKKSRLTRPSGVLLIFFPLLHCMCACVFTCCVVRLQGEVVEFNVVCQIMKTGFDDAVYLKPPKNSVTPKLQLD